MWGENVRKRNYQCSLRTLIISLPRLVLQGKRRLMVTCRVPEPSGPCLALSQKDLVNPAYPPIHQDHCPFPYSQHLLSLSQGCSVGFLLYSFNNHHSSLKYISHLYFGPSTSSLCSCSFHLVLNCFSLSQLVCKVVTHYSENSIKQKCQEGLIL